MVFLSSQFMTCEVMTYWTFKKCTDKKWNSPREGVVYTVLSYCTY